MKRQECLTIWLWIAISVLHLGNPFSFFATTTNNGRRLVLDGRPLVMKTAAFRSDPSPSPSSARCRPQRGRRRSSTIAELRMVSSATPSKLSESLEQQQQPPKPLDKPTTIVTTTANAKANVKYPTARGTTTDARQIIATGMGKRHLEAVRLSHILFCSRELAAETLDLLRIGQQSFEDVAQQVSACETTKRHGGSIGWVQVNENTEGGPAAHSEINSHLDDVLPRAAREQVVQISTKPGDVFMVESPRGYHLVQIVDVMQNVRQMATAIKKRRGTGTTSLNALKIEPKPQRLYKIETMGCQMNQADSERIEGQLQSLGMRPVRDHDKDGNNSKNSKREDPDVVVLNTCSIRDHAEQKVYSYIGPHAKRKRDGHDVTIVVAGCVAQQTGELLLRRAPEVDLVMGPQYANRLADLLEDVQNGNQVVATEAVHIMEDSTKPRRSSTVAAWVNVIYGCNERCTFCIVPTTRGVEQSRPVESIVQEVTDLVRDGYQEVTLLGQNIDAYGRDMVPKRKFSDLIRIVGNVPGLKRLRFVTSHPRYMSMGVVEAVAETPAACESFHIPFQSGSNEVLAAMGRGHTREKYLHIVDRIRSRIPDASITADVIVGFPGETDEQFQDTLALMEEVVFDSVNTAAYSPRPNTPAALWDNQVGDEVKQDRLRRINEVNKRHASERRARRMGRVEEVLVEERNVRVPTQVMGRTRHGYIVYCEGDIDLLRGRLVKVLIDTCHTYYLAGTIVD